MALFELPAGADCLYTTVRCVASQERFFGFLPPHGRRLASGEELTVVGDIQAFLTKLTPNDRARRSLHTALLGDDEHSATLVIVKTPAVHLYDDTLDQTKIHTLDNGSTVYADPCWGSWSSA